MEKYEEENSTTINAYRGKVKKYISLHKNKELEDGLNKANLESFIFNNAQKCLENNQKFIIFIH